MPVPLPMSAVTIDRNSSSDGYQTDDCPAGSVGLFSGRGPP
jgi:hypothetical protein